MMFTEEFGLQDVPEGFVLLVHSFGYTITSGIAKEAVMKITETASIDEQMSFMMLSKHSNLAMSMT